MFEDWCDAVATDDAVASRFWRAAASHTAMPACLPPAFSAQELRNSIIHAFPEHKPLVGSFADLTPIDAIAMASTS
jgi:hypothetical protein